MSWVATDAHALLRAPAIQVFKSDRRSRVWRVRSPQGQWVVKRFEQSPLQQCMAMWIGLHPAQRELRRNRAMAKYGLPVTPVTSWGKSRHGLGCKLWLATPYVGLSLLRHLRDGLLADFAARRAMTGRVAALLGALLEHGYVHRDLKTSNILVGEGGRLEMIDVGAARASRSRSRFVQMLSVLDASAVLDGVSRAERRRCLCLLVRAKPGLGPIRDLAAQVLARSV